MILNSASYYANTIRHSICWLLRVAPSIFVGSICHQMSPVSAAQHGRPFFPAQQQHFRVPLVRVDMIHKSKQHSGAMRSWHFRVQIIMRSQGLTSAEPLGALLKSPPVFSARLRVAQSELTFALQLNPKIDKSRTATVACLPIQQWQRRDCILKAEYSWLLFAQFAALLYFINGIVLAVCCHPTWW